MVVKGPNWRQVVLFGDYSTVARMMERYCQNICRVEIEEVSLELLRGAIEYLEKEAEMEVQLFSELDEETTKELERLLRRRIGRRRVRDLNPDTVKIIVVRSLRPRLCLQMVNFEAVPVWI